MIAQHDGQEAGSHQQSRGAHSHMRSSKASIYHRCAPSFRLNPTHGRPRPRIVRNPYSSAITNDASRLRAIAELAHPTFVACFPETVVVAPRAGGEKPPDEKTA